MGKELVGMKYVSPLTGEDCPIVTADYVTADSGTCNLFCVFRFTWPFFEGVVHIAPAHGIQDYLVAKSNGLKLETVGESRALRFISNWRD